MNDQNISSANVGSANIQENLSNRFTKSDLGQTNPYLPYQIIALETANLVGQLKSDWKKALSLLMEDSPNGL